MILNQALRYIVAYYHIFMHKKNLKLKRMSIIVRILKPRVVFLSVSCSILHGMLFFNYTCSFLKK